MPWQDGGWNDKVPVNFIIYFISVKIKANKYNFVSAHRQEFTYSEVKKFNVNIPEINAMPMTHGCLP